jgi:hypothetical protein
MCKIGIKIGIYIGIKIGINVGINDEYQVNMNENNPLGVVRSMV